MNGLQSLRQAFTLLPRPYAPTLLAARRGLAGQPRDGDEINPNVPAHGTRVKNFADDDTTWGKEGVQGTLSRAVNVVTDAANKVAESIKEVTGLKSTTLGEETPAERGARRTQESVQEGAARFKEGASQGMDTLKEGASQARDNAEHGASQADDGIRQGASQVGDKAQQGWEKTKDVAQDLKEGAQNRTEQAGQGVKGVWEKTKEAFDSLEPERHQQRAEERRSAGTTEADRVGTANADRASPPYGRPGVGPADQAGS